MADEGNGAYRRADIQGDVLPGFRARDDATFHQHFLLARIVVEVDRARRGLRRLLDAGLVSSGADVARDGPGRPPSAAFVNVAFTAGGLARLGRPSTDPVLTAGPGERGVLGDPAGWTFGGPGSGVDVVVNIGAPDADAVAETAARVRSLLGSGYTVVHEIDGAKLPGGTEHFGFRDGLAQPFVADDRRTRGTSGSAVWPNWEALRLRAEAEQAAARHDAAQAELAAAAAAARPGAVRVPDLVGRRLADARVAADQTRRVAEKARQAADQEALNEVVQRSPGVPIRPVEQFVLRDGDAVTAHGSFMVLLQLEQRTADFWAMCRELAGRLQAAFGRAVDEEDAAGLLLGRRLDGTPLEPHPDGVPEDFSYFGDRAGRTCPAGAHVRLTNPRDYQSAGAMILRRGIPYGPPAPDRTTRDGVDRGLLFVCYQADIEQQYEQIQGRFADAGYADGQPTARFPDVLISGRGRDGSTVEIPDPGGRGSVGARLLNTWVVPRGGLYLFAPSMRGLVLLSEPA